MSEKDPQIGLKNPTEGMEVMAMGAMTLEEIKQKYRGEWVLIAYTELDNDMCVVKGEVLAHSPDRDEIYRKLLSIRGRKVAVEYMGEIPNDLAVAL